MGRKNFRVGLTGGIASGKSTVSAMLRELGATVVDTDRIARDLTRPGSEALQAMSRLFGTGILNRDGSLRRDVVGRIVFTDPEKKRWLENLLHPLILERAEEQAAAAFAAGDRIVFFDVPLLFETGWDRWVDMVWTVYVPPEMQKDRLMQRDGFSGQEAMDRIGSQWPIGEKAGRADLVIDNSGPLSQTRCQVENAWNDLLRRLQDRDAEQEGAGLG